MKLTVLTWFKEVLLSMVGKIIEILFRVLLLLTPMGVYLIVLQNRAKASKVSSISVYTNDSSVWQHIFPGFMLVAVDPNMLKNDISRVKGTVQRWIESNKYLLAMLLLSSMVLILILINHKLGL